jgi:hypothetical protein
VCVSEDEEIKALPTTLGEDHRVRIGVLCTEFNQKGPRNADVMGRYLFVPQSKV